MKLVSRGDMLDTFCVHLLSVSSIYVHVAPSLARPELREPNIGGHAAHMGFFLILTTAWQTRVLSSRIFDSVL